MNGFEKTFPSGSGTYLLIMKLDEKSEIHVGKTGIHIFQPGWYLYLGSAFGPGGLKTRLGRHIQGGQKTFWHIDYLRSNTDLIEVWFQVLPQPNEHQIAGWLSSQVGIEIPIPGFGSSDCSCESHLFFIENLESLKHTRSSFKAGEPGDYTWSFMRHME